MISEWTSSTCNAASSTEAPSCQRTLPNVTPWLLAAAQSNLANADFRKRGMPSWDDGRGSEQTLAASLRNSSEHTGHTSFA